MDYTKKAIWNDLHKMLSYYDDGFADDSWVFEKVYDLRLLRDNVEGNREWT